MRLRQSDNMSLHRQIMQVMFQMMQVMIHMIQVMIHMQGGESCLCRVASLHVMSHLCALCA